MQAIPHDSVELMSIVPSLVLKEVIGRGVVKLSMNHPVKFNVLSTAMIQTLTENLQTLSEVKLRTHHMHVTFCISTVVSLNSRSAEYLHCFFSFVLAL